MSLQRCAGQQQSEGALGAAVRVTERGLGRRAALQKEPRGTAAAADGTNGSEQRLPLLSLSAAKGDRERRGGSCEQVSPWTRRERSLWLKGMFNTGTGGGEGKLRGGKELNLCPGVEVGLKKTTAREGNFDGRVELRGETGREVRQGEKRKCG